MDKTQREDIDAYIQFALPILMERLEEKLVTAFDSDHNRMIEAEIQKVHRHLTDREMSPMFAFPYKPKDESKDSIKVGTAFAGGTLFGTFSKTNDLAEFYHKIANNEWGAFNMSDLSTEEYGLYKAIKTLEAYERALQDRIKVQKRNRVEPN